MTHIRTQPNQIIKLIVAFSILTTTGTSNAQSLVIKIPAEHTITAWYIKASQKKPFGLYTESVELAKYKKKYAKEKPACYLQKRTFVSIRQKEKGFALVMPLHGKCGYMSRWVKLSSLAHISYHYTFDSKKIHDAWTIILPKHYQRIKEFKNIKGPLSYSIEGENPSLFTLHLYKGNYKLTSRLKNFEEIRSYPCGCVTFILEVFYEEKIFSYPDTITKKIIRRPLLKWLKYFDKYGKPTNPDGPHARKYTILRPNTLNKAMLKVSEYEGNGGPNEPSDKLVRVNIYYHNIKSNNSQHYLGAKDYWDLVVFGVRL